MKNKSILILSIISAAYCSDNGAKVTADTLATINNRTISKQDFIAQAQSVANTPSVNLKTNDGRIDVLKDMINEELVFQQALRENYHLDNLNIKHEVVREYLKQKFTKDLPTITDDQAKQYYNENQSRLDQIRASHILIKTDKKDPSSKKKAKAEIQKIRAEIVSGKITFAKAAEKYSQDDGSKKNWGDLSFFNRTKMVEPFANAAFNLKKIGEVSQPVESEFGYHIIELTGESRGYEVYKEKIKWKLYQDAMKPRIDSYFKELNEKSQVKITNSDLIPLNIPQL